MPVGFNSISVTCISSFINEDQVIEPCDQSLPPPNHLFPRYKRTEQCEAEAPLTSHWVAAL